MEHPGNDTVFDRQMLVSAFVAELGPFYALAVNEMSLDGAMLAKLKSLPGPPYNGLAPYQQKMTDIFIATFLKQEGFTKYRLKKLCDSLKHTSDMAAAIKIWEDHAG